MGPNRSKGLSVLAGPAKEGEGWGEVERVWNRISQITTFNRGQSVFKAKQKVPRGCEKPRPSLKRVGPDVAPR